MSILRVRKTKDFTVMANMALRDAGLSMKAKGLWAYLMSLPDDWRIYQRELTKHFRDGEEAIARAMKELCERGYVVRNRVRNKQGHVKGWEYDVGERPLRHTEKPETENQRGEKPKQDKPKQENPVLPNTDFNQDTNGTNCDACGIAKRREDDMLKTRAKMQAEITAVSQVKTRGHGHSEPGRYHSAAEALGVVEDARTERREAGKKGRLTVRSLSRVWQEAVADNYEGMTGAITQRQGLLLRSYATVYAARGDGGFEVFSRYVQWVIGNWTAVVAARLYWMDSKPDRPDAGVFCSTSLRGHFESAYRDRQKVEAHRGLTRRESYKLEHVQAGKEAAEAERLTVAKFGAEEQLADLQDMTARMQEAFAALSRGLSTEEAQEQRQGRYRALQGRMEAYTAKYGGTPLEEQLELLRKLGGETKA